MANIFTSSIGKKVIMSISGLFLILFLVLHMGLNITSIFSEETFQQVCDFMALPIVSILVPVLALGFVTHILSSLSHQGFQTFERIDCSQHPSLANLRLRF
jgi:succinate dehydrogenase / fumarate reductase cytochrome b subunit